MSMFLCCVLRVFLQYRQGSFGDEFEPVSFRMVSFGTFGKLDSIFATCGIEGQMKDELLCSQVDVVRKR